MASDKDKIKSKKKKGKGSFWGRFWLVYSGIRFLSRMGIPLPAGLASRIEDLTQATGIDLDSIQEKSAEILGDDVVEGLGDAASAVKDSSIRLKDVRKAGKMAGKIGDAAAYGSLASGGSHSSTGMHGKILASDISSDLGSDAVNGIVIEDYARITKEITKCGGNVDCMNRALSAKNLDMAAYQELATGFGKLMQEDSSGNLARRYTAASS